MPPALPCSLNWQVKKRTFIYSNCNCLLTGLYSKNALNNCLLGYSTPVVSSVSNLKELGFYHGDFY